MKLFLVGLVSGVAGSLRGNLKAVERLKEAPRQARPPLAKRPQMTERFASKPSACKIT